MYGLVNRAIEQLVVSQGGATAWQRVCERAGIGSEGFLAVQAYPDCMTYRLVAAVAQELGISQAQALEAFGEYWILYTAEEGYAEVLKAGGNDLRVFMTNLNDMHARIEAVFPNMVVPDFVVDDQPDGSFMLHYHSSRDGLAPMVIGLMRGLARRFNQSADITHVGLRGDQGHDTFHVRLSAAG